jgi:hypothetical protein
MSENVLPLITDKQIDKGATLLDNLVDFTKVFKNKIMGAGAELLDGKAFKLALSGINNLVSKHIPDEFKDEFQVAFDDVLDGDKDFTEASDQFFIVGEQLISKLQEKNVKPYVISGAKVIIEMIKTFVHMTLENLATEKEEV